MGEERAVFGFPLGRDGVGNMHGDEPFLDEVGGGADFEKGFVLEKFGEERSQRSGGRGAVGRVGGRAEHEHFRERAAAFVEQLVLQFRGLGQREDLPELGGVGGGIDLAQADEVPAEGDVGNRLRADAGGGAATAAGDDQPEPEKR